MEKQTIGSSLNEAAKESQSEKAVSVSSVSHPPNDLQLDGLIAPTAEEVNTLRHVADKINWRAYR